METLAPKMLRERSIAALRKRDGDFCMHPDCGKILDFSIVDDNDGLFVTIDHWIPKYECDRLGWTHEQKWDDSNLRLMHKECNAKKGDLIPNEDGTLPEKPAKRKFRYRRQKRATRPEICTVCSNGRGLGPDEVCASCNSGPQPERFPRWAKMPSNECDHELFWCAWCSIGVIQRAPAVNTALLQGESGEWT